MARPKTKSATTTVATEDAVATVNNVVAEENIELKEKAKESKKVVEKKLVDSDEIEVVSIVPHVSYQDSKTGDMYEWEEVGHIEYMTVETLKNMWRNHKGYFKNLLLKPMDDRVVNQFGLKSTFEKYEFLMKESSYTKRNVNSICKTISDVPNGLKYAVCNKIKDMVMDGLVTDVSVIRALEKQLDIDLISFL